jgi:hypothetical protein
MLLSRNIDPKRLKTACLQYLDDPRWDDIERKIDHVE